MLPFHPRLAELVQRVHGRWYPKVELLADSSEHIRDYKEGMQQGVVSGTAVEYSDDGTVRLAATALQDIAFATGTANFTGLIDDLIVNTQRALIYELEAGRNPLQITKATLRLHRKPNAGLAAFDGSFILYAFFVDQVGFTSTDAGGGVIVNTGGYSLVPLGQPVEVPAANVAWAADVAEVDFVFQAPGIDTKQVRQGTDRPAGKLHVLFYLTIARGQNSNAAWIHDTAQVSGEATTATKGTLSWWNVDRTGVSIQVPQGGTYGSWGANKPSAGGWYRLTKSTSLGRAAITIRTNTGALSTITFKPTVLVARKSTSAGVGSPPATARLTGLGYTVTENLSADLATCRGFDVVVIDCDAWSIGEFSAFIKTLLDDGQRVLCCGNDTGATGTDVFFSTASHSTSTHGPNKVSAATKLLDHAVWEAVTTMPDDSDSGNHLTGIDLQIATAYGAFANDGAAYSVIEVFDATGHGGIVLFVPRITLTGNDSDRFFRNAVDYLGRKDFDLGSTPTADVEYVGTSDLPLGTATFFEFWDGTNWTAYGDGDRAVLELPTAIKRRASWLRVTLQGSPDNLRSPVLRSIGVREVDVSDLSNFCQERPDTFYQVTDIPKSMSEVAELPLRIVRHGLKGDAEDLISRIVAGSANVTAMHVRLSIAAGGLNTPPTGAAMQFPGKATTSWVKRTTVGTWPTVNLTAECWFKCRREDFSSPTVGFGLMSYAGGANANAVLMFLFPGGPGATNRFDLYLNDVAISTPTNYGADDGQWHHAVYTWASTGGAVRFYLDGLLRFEGVNGAGATIPAAGAFYLAQDQDAVDGGLDANQALVGSMDEVRVYSRVISDQEAAEHARGLFTNNANLVLRWTFDERVQAAPADSSGTGNAGTGSNCGIDLEPAPPWAGIGVSRSREFHADTYRVDDYLPSEAGLDLYCVSALDRLKLPVPRRKITAGNWVVDPARYDAALGHTLSSVFLDIRDGQLGLSGRYAGSIPQGGPIDRAGVQWSKIQGQIGAPGVGTAGKTEVAKDVLEQLARIAGGVLTTSQGRIHYRDLFGPKDSVGHFPEAEVVWEATPPGLRLRAPRVLVSFQPTTLGGKDWTKSIEREDAGVIFAVEQAGTEAGTHIDQVPDEVCRWIRVSNPTSLTDATVDDAEGLADALAHRHVRMFGAGVLIWRFSTRIPHPHYEIGDMITAGCSKFVGRDPVLGTEVRGPINVRGVIVGRNLWGTKFAILVRSYADILTTSRAISARGTYEPTVQLVVEDVDGRPDQARVRVRANPDTAEVTIRYKLVSSTATVPERSTDGAVWTTYAGPVIVTRDAALVQRFVAWADWLGAWGPREVAEIANDRRPQILSLTLSNSHIDVAHQDVAHSDTAHGDTAHADSHGDTIHQDSHSDGHSDVGPH